MRLALVLIGTLNLALVQAQASSSVDAEYTAFCMVDSIDADNQLRFTRLLSIASFTFKDYLPETGSVYNPVGKVITCSSVDADRVQNRAGQLPLANSSLTLAANEYNSVSIYVTQGPVQITLQGVSINYPQGWNTVWSAQPGKLLTNTIQIDASGGEVIISYVQ